LLGNFGGRGRSWRRVQVARRVQVFVRVWKWYYDGDGRRVAKANAAVPPVPYKLYWYGSGGEILAETDGSGNNPNEYVFFGGKRIAMLPAGSTAQFYVEDSLGSSRVITNNTGVVCYEGDFYPYGGERAVTTSCTQNDYKFEGKERDVETSVGPGNTNGNDDFGARYYSNRFGRWLSADWSNLPVPVPYANLTNPQTLNLYSMVHDDPESFADLDGHENPNWTCNTTGRDCPPVPCRANTQLRTTRTATNPKPARPRRKISTTIPTTRNRTADQERNLREKSTTRPLASDPQLTPVQGVPKTCTTAELESPKSSRSIRASQAS
jgi:RHS repeat-associated protein